MRTLAFAASCRTRSLNRRLIRCAAAMAGEEGFAVAVDVAEFADFDMPIYNGDREAREGIPPGASRLVEEVRRSDALIIAAPEYNYSISGPLKNAIDWVSRARPMPWRGKSVYLIAASPSPMGGIRGLWQTRIPLEACGAMVFPDMFALAHANEAFDEPARLRDEKLALRLRVELVGFLKLAEAVIPVVGEREVCEDELRARRIAAALEEQSEIQGPA